MTSRVDTVNGWVDSGVGVFEHTVASLAIPAADGVVSWLAAALGIVFRAAKSRQGEATE
jgi:hypothetical protein